MRKIATLAVGLTAVAAFGLTAGPALAASAPRHVQQTPAGESPGSDLGLRPQCAYSLLLNLLPDLKINGEEIPLPLDLFDFCSSSFPHFGIQNLIAEAPGPARPSSGPCKGLTFEQCLKTGYYSTPKPVKITPTTKPTTAPTTPTTAPTTPVTQPTPPFYTLGG